MAECELSVLTRQCLNRRLPDQDTVEHEVVAWQDQRNSQQISIDWHFTAEDARVKLKHLYPTANVHNPT